MIGTIAIAIAILAIGARAGDGLRLRQQEAILRKLAPPAAAAFYRVLRRRAWRTRILRAVSVISLVAILYARNRAWRVPALPAAPHVDAARTVPHGPGGAGASSPVKTGP
ncbi:MAG: hypothetical protein ABUS79_05515 [Pseudomonadota bacterium]